jgi:purine-binding chemotaxis protein CheW
MNPDPSGAADVEALTFELGGEIFALDAGVVREVLDLLPETRVPGAQAFVDAVINFRGRVIPLVDLRVAFGLDRLAPTADSRIIVIEQPIDGTDLLIGLRADKVREVATIAAEATEAAPPVGLRWRREFISGLAKADGDLIVLPNFDNIFQACRRAA